MDVWYASYGSNLLEARFLAYILGGSVPGSDRPEVGCTDKKLPSDSKMLNIPYPLYFSKEKSKWGKGGVAFIGTEKVDTEATIGRMYRITEEQFLEVVAQENNRTALSMNIDKVMKQGFLDLDFGWYNRIVYLGKQEGAPIFTFTSSLSMDEVHFTKPTAAYLATIAKGLIELGVHHEEIVDYFIDKRGIKGIFNKGNLSEYLKG